jgi:hypothetical protein
LAASKLVTRLALALASPSTALASYSEDCVVEAHLGEDSSDAVGALGVGNPPPATPTTLNGARE